MKKRILSVLLCATFVFGLSSCTSTSKNTGSDDASDSKAVTSSTEAAKPGYEDLPYYLNPLSEQAVSDVKQAVTSKSKYHRLELYKEMQDYVLSIKLPESVTIEAVKEVSETSGASEEKPRYLFSINNTPVGECSFDTLALPKYAERLSKDTKPINDRLSVSKMELKCSVNEESWEIPVYRIQAWHLKQQNFAVLTLRQDVFTYDQILEIANALQFHYQTAVTKAGKVDYSGKECKALILGNSFIASSQIGYILENIANTNDVNLQVYALGRGNANVATFAYDIELMNEIKRGTYDVIFLCGFYADGDRYTDLQQIISYLPETTQLVIFPAHNEHPELPYSCRAQNPEVGLADWKGFIEQQINDGLDARYLCIDDYYKHSTPLAGYAGACLIYSYLYKKAVANDRADGFVIEYQTKSYDVSREEVAKQLANIREATYNYLYN